VVVNNAGLAIYGEFESLSEEQVSLQLNTNLFGVINVTREALKVMREINKPIGGRILQISSVGGIFTYPTVAVYNASKHAIEGFSEAVSKELNPEWNIKITLIEPGGFRTEIFKKGIYTTPLEVYKGSPAEMTRAYTSQWIPEGDPLKAAQVIFRISNEPNPPLRLALGNDAVDQIKQKLESVKKELELWEEVSRSTAFEDQKQK